MQPNRFGVSMRECREAVVATQISRVGNSVTVEIPEELLRKARLSVGDPVEWTLTGSGNLALHAPGNAGAPEVEEGYEEWVLAEIEAGIAACQEGRTVSEEKAVEWLRSWGTEKELPAPQRN